MSGAESLAGAVAVVTGASSGIGEATALALADAGARVAIVARREERLRDLAARIAATGAAEEAIVLGADLSDGEQAEAAIAKVAEQAGRIDILVNNAGVMLLGPIENAPVDEWERMIEINVKGLIRCARAALPHLLDAAGKGPREVADMVNVSSVAGRSANAGSGVYNLTKFGIGAFSESLRQEVTQRQIRVGLIEPGAVDTELPDHNRPEIRQMIAKRFENVERLRSEDIAEAILYMVTRPRYVSVNEILIRPTHQQR